jgi:pimeloyl-ACP methyl ester carboxylesterase
VRLAPVLLALLVFALPAGAAAGAVLQPPGPHPLRRTILYRAHDGAYREAILLLPHGYGRHAIPLVISPHGRGVTAAANARLWGDLPDEGDFAVINPAGEGRRLGLYSWGDPGQISDLARMPAIAQTHGVHVDRHRVYAIGGSMGGQEVLLLAARHPHLLAGVVAFDPATNMARRYWDFAKLPHGRHLQALARREVGGTPLTTPAAYAARSPETYARQLALSHVPIELYWSKRDRVIADQIDESAVLVEEILGWNPHAPLLSFHGEWQHTAEMHAYRRLPPALVRLGLLNRVYAQAA